MIKFKQEITVPDELVRGLAIDLGWEEKIEIDEANSVDNTESYIDFVDKVFTLLVFA